MFLFPCCSHVDKHNNLTRSYSFQNTGSKHPVSEVSWLLFEWMDGYLCNLWPMKGLSIISVGHMNRNHQIPNYLFNPDFRSWGHNQDSSAKSYSWLGAQKPCSAKAQDWVSPRQSLPASLLSHLSSFYSYFLVEYIENY